MAHTDAVPGNPSTWALLEPAAEIELEKYDVNLA